MLLPESVEIKTKTAIEGEGPCSLQAARHPKSLGISFKCSTCIENGARLVALDDLRSSISVNATVKYSMRSTLEAQVLPYCQGHTR